MLSIVNVDIYPFQGVEETIINTATDYCYEADFCRGDLDEITSDENRVSSDEEEEFDEEIKKKVNKSGKLIWSEITVVTNVARFNGVALSEIMH